MPSPLLPHAPKQEQQCKKKKQREGKLGSVIVGRCEAGDPVPTVHDTLAMRCKSSTTHCPLRGRQDANCNRSFSTHCPQAAQQCLVAIPPPTCPKAARQCFRCPPPQANAAVFGTRSTALYPHAVCPCAARVPQPTSPRRWGSV